MFKNEIPARFNVMFSKYYTLSHNPVDESRLLCSSPLRRCAPPKTWDCLGRPFHPSLSLTGLLNHRPRLPSPGAQGGPSAPRALPASHAHAHAWKQRIAGRSRQPALTALVRTVLAHTALAQLPHGGQRLHRSRARARAHAHVCKQHTVRRLRQCASSTSA